MHYRGKRYYHSSFDPMRYYAHPAVHTYFSSIVADLKEYFFNLPAYEFDNFIVEYTKKHGYSAGNYAKKTYPKWKSHSINLSDQTLMRLIELLPPFLTADQRISLLKKIIQQNRSTVPQIMHNVNVNWENYIDAIQELNKYIPARIELNDEAILRSVQIPSEVKELATGLYADDMKTANILLNEVYIQEARQLFTSALDDVKTFHYTCNKMYNEGLIYEDLRMTIRLPADIIFVTVHKLNKGYCFISTTCFGAESPETIFFRVWRDQTLHNYYLGNKFIDWYYNNGRCIANFLTMHSWMKLAMQIMLHGIYKVLKFWRGKIG